MVVMVANKKVKVGSKVVSKTKKTSGGSGLKTFYQKYKLGVNLALLVLLVFGGWYAYSLPRMQEKQDLIEKHQKLEEIANTLTTEFGFKVESSQKYCYGLSGFKYEKQEIGCSAEIELKNRVDGVDEANKVKGEIKDELSLEFKRSGDPRSNLLDFDSDSDKSFFANIFGVSYCKINLKLNENKDELLFKLGCTTSPAKDEHFPLRK
jgi:hypothetical protein